MGILDKALDAMDAPSRWGANIARQDLSEPSIKLAQKYGDLKDKPPGDDLGDCARKAVVGAVTGQKPDCDPDAQKVTADVSGRVVSRVAQKAIGSTTFFGLGLAKDLVTGRAEIVQNHQGAIEVLAENKVPGFGYEEVDLGGGIKHRVWVDATAEALKENGKPKIYEETRSTTAQPEQELATATNNPWDRTAKQGAQSKALSTALGGMQDYIAQNGLQAYKDRLTDEADNKIYDYMQKRYDAAHPPAPAGPSAPKP